MFYNLSSNQKFVVCYLKQPGLKLYYVTIDSHLNARVCFTDDIDNAKKFSVRDVALHTSDTLKYLYGFDCFVEKVED